MPGRVLAKSKNDQSSGGEIGFGAWLVGSEDGSKLTPSLIHTGLVTNDIQNREIANVLSLN